MSSDNKKVAVNIAIGVLGRWKETYKWVPIFGAVTAIAMAFSVGANNLPASFSTPVGSGTMTLLQASIAACFIYVPGAAFTSNNTVSVLFQDFIRENQPNEGLLMWSMVCVLITATIWLVIATSLELPVSSQQSIQGALLGTMLVTEGFGFIPLWNKNENHNFNGGGILWIFLEWTVAPLIACFFAFCFFTILKAYLLRPENAKKRIFIFLPIFYGITAGMLCFFVMYQVIPNFKHVYKWITILAVTLATFIGALLSLVEVVPLVRQRLNTARNFKTMRKKSFSEAPCIEAQEQTSNTELDEQEKFEEALKNFMQRKVLDTVYEEDERSWASPESNRELELVQSVSQPSTGQSTPLKQLLESTPNRLVQSRNFQKIKKTTTGNAIRDFTRSKIFPVIEYDRHTLIRHALAEKFEEMEEFFGFLQVLASCIFALIQSACEVAAVVSPFGAILDVFTNRAKYSGNAEDVGYLNVNWWFRALGGLSASMGFFLCGWRLTQSLGGKLTYISNSRGMALQLSTVATIIMVTKLKLPVSSVHAFVGSSVGVGIADDPRNVNWKYLVKILCGWVMTVVFCCSVAFAIYAFTIHSPAYVVP